MFRLRTTTGLSLLALVVGVAGTAWLSEQTAGWAGPEKRMVQAGAPRHVPAMARARHAAQAKVSSVTSHAVHWPPIDHAQAATVPEDSVVAPTLTPIEMPAAPMSLFSRRVARAGRVVLRLAVDGQGNVTRAAVGESSGDTQLDDEAVRTVKGWRFAVPADHPDGISGDLPMRFDADAKAADGF
ncbi:energy transducer TonB family protein [Dyella subtropica]|uniref:energy transducer TonB family protein n=1 Tax=Dyella subtropica TaxID=2992127 RepID=UPI00225522A5|nr:energy transducer TonB [Dyella subtropica]